MINSIYPTHNSYPYAAYDKALKIIDISLNAVGAIPFPPLMIVVAMIELVVFSVLLINELIKKSARDKTIKDLQNEFNVLKNDVIDMTAQYDNELARIEIATQYVNNLNDSIKKIDLRCKELKNEQDYRDNYFKYKEKPENIIFKGLTDKEIEHEINELTKIENEYISEHNVIIDQIKVVNTIANEIYKQSDKVLDELDNKPVQISRLYKNNVDIIYYSGRFLESILRLTLPILFIIQQIEIIFMSFLNIICSIAVAKIQYDRFKNTAE